MEFVKWRGMIGWRYPCFVFFGRNEVWLCARHLFWRRAAGDDEMGRRDWIEDEFDGFCRPAGTRVFDAADKHEKVSVTRRQTICMGLGERRAMGQRSDEARGRSLGFPIMIIASRHHFFWESGGRSGGPADSLPSDSKQCPALMNLRTEYYGNRQECA